MIRKLGRFLEILQIAPRKLQISWLVHQLSDWSDSKIGRDTFWLQTDRASRTALRYLRCGRVFRMPCETSDEF